MRVSIIMPIYKVEKEIERALLSVINQDYKDIELILIDDASPDNSLNVARNMLENIQHISVKFVKHIHNKGLSSARNSGIKEATGDYVFFLDSDDAITHSKVITNLITATKYGNNKYYELVVGNFRHVLLTGNYQKMIQNRGVYHSKIDSYSQYAKGKIHIIACGKLISRDFIMKNDLFFEEDIYHEDELWAFRLFQEATHINVLSDIIYDYFQREGSISFYIKEKNIEDLTFIIEKMYHFYLNDHSDFKRWTALKIEKLKRVIFKSLGYFEDEFIRSELTRLSLIKTYLVSRNMKLILQNIVLWLPISMSSQFLKKQK